MPVDFDHILLTLLILIAALLYASVGHGGASGYLAAMALVGMSPAAMKPVALILNVFVSLIALFRFYGAGAFSWSLFWPLILTSIPCAYLGGLLTLPTPTFKMLVGMVLLFSAWQTFRTAHQTDQITVRVAPRTFLLGAGAGLGLLSGLTGVGGGIFLSPLLLFMRWAETKVISGIAAAFILVNSIAGLLGFLSSNTLALPAALPYWIIAAIIGGYIGAEFGSRRLRNPTIRRLLGLVLCVAGIKMVLVH